jgi:hypothetical protein
MDAILSRAWEELYTLKASVADLQMTIEESNRVIANAKASLKLVSTVRK